MSRAGRGEGGDCSPGECSPVLRKSVMECMMSHCTVPFFPWPSMGQGKDCWGAGGGLVRWSGGGGRGRRGMVWSDGGAAWYGLVWDGLREGLHARIIFSV
jgi:hypothetical protein